MNEGWKKLRKQFVFVVTRSPQAGCHIKRIILLCDEAHHKHWIRILCEAWTKHYIILTLFWMPEKKTCGFDLKSCFYYNICTLNDANFNFKAALINILGGQWIRSCVMWQELLVVFFLSGNIPLNCWRDQLFDPCHAPRQDCSLTPQRGIITESSKCHTWVHVAFHVSNNPIEFTQLLYWREPHVCCSWPHAVLYGSWESLSCYNASQPPAVSS